MIQIPVLIAGGGPVGLTLALCLSKQGIKSIVVNERSTPGTHPKLDVVNTRSMEIYRQIGLADRIRTAGNPATANQYTAIAASASGPFYRVMSDRHFIYQPAAQAAKQSAASRDGSLPLESMQRIAQMHLEPVLLQAAREDDNIDVRFGVRLFGFEQDAHGVTAMIQNSANGSHENVRAQYLIGCDGPGSLVRNFLNIDYDGTRDLVGELFIVHFQSDQLASLYPNREPYWHTWIAQPGFQGLLVSPDASRNDYVLHRPFAPRNGETIEQVVERAIGSKLDYRIVQSGAWRPQFLVAESFGRNRTFIAGDAAHQYMPTGGLGMNTGVTEAHNLAWKLAACLKGWGGPRLMASYEVERLPVARRNRDQAKKNAALVFETNFAVTDELLDQTVQGQACRTNLGDVFESKISSLYESMGIEIGYRYRNSPVICSDSEPEPVNDETLYQATTWSGARLPSAALKDGTAVFDLLDPCGFTLLVNGEIDSLALAPLRIAAQSVGCPLRIVHLDDPYLRAIYQRIYVLVRPDQHVCWRADAIPADCTSLINTIRGA
jgi:2-polyprenyl-6-methoxyphenol hydroxylase-like FAD-dependent oxidoreductase